MDENPCDQEIPADGDVDEEKSKETTGTKPAESEDETNSPQNHSSVNVADDDSNDSYQHDKVRAKEASSDEE